MNKHDSNMYSRRFLLRGAGSCIALPFLQSLAGVRSASSAGGLVELGGQAVQAAAATAVGSPKSASGIPKRLVFLPMGYGVNAQNWFPSAKQPGRNYDLPPLVQPFEDLKDDISFVQNLKCARIPDPHAGSKNFLTCIQAHARKDKNFRNGVSCDQLAAELLGKDTRFSYLALGSSSGPDGHGGYTSWGHDGKPVGLHRTPTNIYSSLFGTGGKAHEIRAKLARQESSLDALLSEAKKLNRQVSAEDRDRVDEYFTSIRNIENRLTKAQDWADTPYPAAPFKLPKGSLGGKERIELVLDMMVAAIRSDSTRVMTYMLPTGPILKSLRIFGNPHRMSHQGSGDWDPANPRSHQRRDIALSNFVAGFIRKLKNTKEADGSSLLDHTLVAYGSCLRQGHGVSRGPLILAGHGGGGLKQGQNLILPAGKIPLANLWLSMIRHVGVDQKKFANSNGVIKELGFS